MSALTVLIPLCFTALIFDSVSSQALRPPSFRSTPSTQILYFSGQPQERLTLPCVATGYPNPQYEWVFNGNLLQGVVPVSDGTIVFNPPGPERVGVYQCRAINSVGIAVSNATLVRLAVLAAFSKADVTRSVTVGSKLVLPCQPQSFGVPNPRNFHTQRDFKWKYENDGSLYLTGRRAQIDEFGNLMIGYVTMADHSPDNPLACYVTNRILNSDAWGSVVTLTVSGQAAASTPAIMGWTNSTMNSNGLSSTVVALVGRSTTLRCFFSGSDSITVTWTKTGGQKPTDGRLQELNFGTEFYLTNVQKSDEGQYVCSSGQPGATDFTYSLVVQAAPLFVTPDSAPSDRNVSVGDEIYIQCNPYAIPDATIVWYKDGNVLDPTDSSLYNRFQWSNNNRMLTVFKVCKDNCTGNDNGPMVIQCNASNVHGYQYINGYVNVFVRTLLTASPSDVNDAILGQKYNFSATATTDPNTPLTYAWYFRPDEDSDWQPIATRDSYVLSNDTRSLTIQQLNSNAVGFYQVVAFNGVSKATHGFVVKQTTRMAAVWAFWWIPLLVLLLFIILLIIICCCYKCKRRNRGYEYHVDQKEREAERNPEKELMDNGFKEHQREIYRPTNSDKQPLTYDTAYETMKR